MISTEKKKEIIQAFQLKGNDTGSSRVQIALLTDRINYLTQHLSLHKKDYSTKRGLLKAVGQRRRLLRYLEKKNHQEYLTLINRLGLRK